MLALLELYHEIADLVARKARPFRRSASFQAGHLGEIVDLPVDVGVSKIWPKRLAWMWGAQSNSSERCTPGVRCSRQSLDMQCREVS
jgi:hypothetical protein